MALATSLYKAQQALKTCDEHQTEEILYFCKTCKIFICLSCGQTSHHGHDWDLISSIAKERHKETPKLCRKIKREKLSECRKKLRFIRSRKKKRAEDIYKLEERRKVMIDMVNRIIDELIGRRDELATNENVLERKYRDLRKKLDFVEKMATCLDVNITSYCDYDVIEMEQDMLKALAEVENYDVDTVAYVPGKINEKMVKEMIGGIAERTIDDSTTISEVKILREFHDSILAIAPISDTQAWIGDDKHTNVKLLSSQTQDTKVKRLPCTDFITLSDGDFIVAGNKSQEIRRITPVGKTHVIVSTESLRPTFISKTQADEILVSLTDDDDDDRDRYKLSPSSRRLVQRMTLTGKVLHTYEFQEDGVTRLFTFPTRTAENGNSDICVVNRVGRFTGELIVLQRDCQMRATYQGNGDSKIDPRDVACDSKRRIILLDCNKCLHLLSPDCTFLGYLLSDMSDYPTTMALYQGCLWIGFNKGIVKVYRYIE